MYSVVCMCMEQLKLVCFLFPLENAGVRDAHIPPTTSRNELMFPTYKFRLMLVDWQRGVVCGGAKVALPALFSLLLLEHCLDFFTVHNVFWMEWHFSRRQLLCNLCGHGVLVFSRLTICTRTNRRRWINGTFLNIKPWVLRPVFAGPDLLSASFVKSQELFLWTCYEHVKIVSLYTFSRQEHSFSVVFLSRW